MRIDWLNDDLTEARVTRGFWWWKRVTILRGTHPPVWSYPSGEQMLDGALILLLDRKRRRELLRRGFDRNWQPVRSLPSARVVKRG
jgi:hypothetical protein